MECLNNADCRTSAQATLGSQAMCHASPSHLCGCATEDPGNVLVNSGFDTTVSGWTSDGSSTLSWGGPDAFQCSLSGSASVTGFNPMRQCARIKGGTRYYFGAMYLTDASSGVDCYVEYHANSSCSDNALGFSSSMSLVSGTWARLSSVSTSPANATYALVGCAQFDAGQAYIDQLYLNAATDGF